MERPAKDAKARRAERVFKTPYFAKQAKDAGISDRELCDATTELRKGQGDPLGGGVWKKRLDYQSADVEQMLKNGDLHEICKDEKEK